MRKIPKIIMTIVATLVVVGAVGVLTYNYSTPVKYNRQLELGNKYLEEQDYEQAKVEFEQAIEIDPMNAEAYLGLAEAYVGLGDYEGALDVSQKGYELTGDEQLYRKLLELKKFIVLPFEITDISICGYNLLEDYYEEVCAAINILPDTEPSSGSNAIREGDIWKEASYKNNSEGNFKSVGEDLFAGSETLGDGSVIYKMHSFFSYHIYFEDDNKISEIKLRLGDGNKLMDLSAWDIEAPIMPGDSYEKFCDLFSISKIKEFADKSGDRYEFNTKYGNGRYREFIVESNEHGKLVVRGASFVIYSDIIGVPHLYITLYIDSSNRIIYCKYGTQYTNRNMRIQ